MNLTIRSIAFLACVGAAFGVQPGLNIVEFSEVSFGPSSGPYPLLAGSPAFVPFGLSFQGSVHLVSSPLFTQAGVDMVGVAPIAPINCPAGSGCFETNPTGNMTFVFNDGAGDFGGVSSARFFWVNLGFTMTATWFDTAGNVLATDTVSPATASGQFSHTAPVGTAIGRVVFSGVMDYYGVGRVEFTVEDSTRTVRGDNTPSADLVASQILCPTAFGAPVRVLVCNGGTLAAAGSSTTVTSSNDLGGVPSSVTASSTVATPALAPGGCTVVSASSAGCTTGRCEIAATVNTGSPAVPETNPTNNLLRFSCVVPPR